MPITGKQSVGSVSNLFQGYWSQVQFRPGNTAAGNSYKYLGVVQEGVLEISREDAEYMGTTFPRVMEVIAPSQAGMSFSGQMDELHHRNLQVSAGIEMNATTKAIADDNDAATLDDPGDYIFPGASCAFDNACVFKDDLRSPYSGWYDEPGRVCWGMDASLLVVRTRYV